MKKLILLTISLLLTANLATFSQSSNVFTDSTQISTGQQIYFSYTQESLKNGEWLITVVTDMKNKIGVADWYMITYTGGNISLIRQIGDNYESYNLQTNGVDSLSYRYFYLISLRMIEGLVQSNQSIIVSDSIEALNDMAPKLKTIRRINELAKFYKP